MFRIRQSYRDDVEGVLAVAEYLDTVNLPADRPHIEGILDRSERPEDVFSARALAAQGPSSPRHAPPRPKDRPRDSRKPGARQSQTTPP